MFNNTHIFPCKTKHPSVIVHLLRHEHDVRPRTKAILFEFETSSTITLPVISSSVVSINILWDLFPATYNTFHSTLYIWIILDSVLSWRYQFSCNDQWRRNIQLCGQWQCILGRRRGCDPRCPWRWPFNKENNGCTCVINVFVYF